MHIPDGYLGPVTYGGFWIFMAPIWMYASKRVKEAFEATRIPFLAMASAFSLVAMVFTVPLPGGTTGHITGAPLIAILLGPWAAVVAVSIAVIIQALVLGEGGITAIGANCFNIAFIGSFVGYGMYALIARIGKALKGKAPLPKPLPFHLAGAAVGAYIGMNAAALFTALELGVQPLIYASGTGGPHYFPFPPSIAIPAVLIPHLTAVGGLEAAVAVLVLTFLRKSQVDAFGGRKMATALLEAGILLLGSSPLYAHDFWIEPKGNDFVLVYGHGTQREEFETTKVKDIWAFDDMGKPIEVRRERTAKGLSFKPVEQPALLVAEIDDGYWSKTIYGWKNLPKRKASRVVEAYRSVSYSKALVAWSDATQKPGRDLKLDIIPLRNPFELKAGDSLPIKVFFQGTPLPAETIEGSKHEKVGTTDRDGVANVPLTQGHQVIKVAHRERLKDDPDADYFSVTTTLTFAVKR